jgi:glycosyltransferase involved in cell wall biosynthesis
MPCFSIIIPTYNAAQTLPKALESVLGQTRKDLEILIIDNCSTDNSLQIANSLNDERIKIHSAKDKGVYDAMNRGIEYARGEWLYFLGSDDHLFDNEVLNDVDAFIHKNSCDVVYGKVVSTRFGGAYGEAFDTEKMLVENICHQAIFFNKHVFEKTGKFDLRYKAQSDWDHNMRWFFSSQIKHVYFDHVIAVYNDGGLSSGGDALFEQHRIANYVRYAGRHLPLKRRLQLIRYGFDKARHEKKTGLSLYMLFTGIKTLMQF